MNGFAILVMAEVVAHWGMPNDANMLRVVESNSGGHLTSLELCEASVEHAQVSEEHGPGVVMQLKTGSATWLAEATGNHLGETLEVVIDGRVVMAPNIAERIAGGALMLPSWNGADLERIVQAMTSPCKSETAGPE